MKREKKAQVKKKPPVQMWVAAALILAVVAGVALYQVFSAPKIELPYLTARYIGIYDMERGRLVYEKDADLPRSPASLTKLMTLFLVYDQLDAGELQYDDTFRVTQAEAETPGSKYGIRPGETLTVRQLIAGTLLSSGCDCVQCLIKLVDGNEADFVARMNQKAGEMGLKGTHFSNPAGLDSADHYMTVRDIATLTAKLIETHPEILELSSQPTVEIEGKEFKNMHRLVGRDERVRGLKTGTTQIGGYNLVTYAEQGEKRYIIVLLDSNNDNTRFSETETVVDVLFGAPGHE